MKKIAFILFLLISTNLFASNLKDTPPIPLDGGIIAPKNWKLIGLEKLPAGPIFIITCDIINPNYKKQYPIVLKILGEQGTFNNLIFNDKSQTLPSAQVKLDKEINKISVEFSGWCAPPGCGDIKLENYDDSDTATITNCKATYAG